LRHRLPDFVRRTSPAPEVSTSVAVTPEPQKIPVDHKVPDVDDRTSPAPEVSTSVAVPQGLDAPFDLYVDAVTNIPDSATVTKVRPGAIAEQSLIKATLFF